MGVKLAPVTVWDAITLAAMGGVIYVGYRIYKAAPTSDQIAAALNPASPDNLVYKGTNSVLGEENVGTAADYFFGGIDLLNPWADDERKRYAKQVYGIGG